MSKNCYTTSFLAGLRPDPRLTVSQWADENRVLSSRASAEAGLWRTERTPYLREIMDTLSPYSRVEEIVFMKASQVGGSECVNNFIGYLIDHVPGPTMLVLPTVELAKRTSKQRIAPLIAESPALKGKVKEARARDSGNTMLAKEFPGGILVITGANSAVGLRSMPARYLLLDEIDAYPMDADGEGEPCALAEKRTNTFKAKRKVVKISTPKFQGSSRIEEAYENSDKRKFQIPCPSCNYFQALIFQQLKWEKGKSEEVYYECENCKGKIFEHQKTKFLNQGKWTPERPGAQGGRIAGFHLNALYSPLGWYSWRDIAREWDEIQEKKDNDRLRTFINTVLGETWKDKGEAPDWELLHARAEAYKIGCPPERVVFLTAGVDVQKDRLECEVKGWGKGRESWSIDYRVLMGDTSQPEVWASLTEVLDETFQSEDGRPLQIMVMAVDAGYNTQSVYDWCRQFQMTRVVAIKGVDNGPVPIGRPAIVETNIQGKTLRRGFRVWPVGTNLLKSELYSWLRLPRPQKGETYPAGYCHFPQYGEDYFKQLTAETLVKKTIRGFLKFEWVKVRDRNEALDLHIYNRAAASHFGMDRFDEVKWDTLKAEMPRLQIQRVEKTLKKQPNKTEIKRRPSSGWL